MPITDRVTLFGYSAEETERIVKKLQTEYEENKEQLTQEIEELNAQIEKIKNDIEYAKNNKNVVVKKRQVETKGSNAKEEQITKVLYDAHLKATEKVVRAQKEISNLLEKKEILILMRERKANEMKNDLHNLIDYINSIAKNY